ncbi:MAG: histidinol-phosphatase, partial [Candidatus Poribacteria bacterium]|nr:histidinol-phosphatase [Candidatus Poribacteria bacterium]
KFLPYEYLYRTIRTHVLLNEPLSKSSLHEDKRKIYAALKAGNCFIAHDIIADSSGFLFSGNTKDSSDLIMGQETKFNHMVELCVSVPYQAEIQLLRNGETIKNINEKKLHISTDKSGVYRVEVYLDGRPWIFSNPIFLRNS